MFTRLPANLRCGLTQAEAAIALKVSERTLLNWRKSKFGPLPVHDSGRWLYDRGEVVAFVAGAAK